jgi:hypothetical protein
MSAPREALFAALFAVIETLVAPTGEDLTEATPLRVASRSLRSWDDVGPGECPIAFLVAAGEQRQTKPGFPSTVQVEASLIIYAKNEDGRNTVPSTAVNAIISAVGTTLGGLCYTCTIGQRIEIFEGFIGVDTAP